MDEALPEGIRTAVFVDFENVHYHDPKAFGPEGAKRFAEDLLTVAHQCGPVVVAQAVAPWEALPGCAAALHDAGFDPVYCRGAMKNEADLLVVQKLAGLDERTGLRVVFLVSGDGHMTGATRKAQAAGLRVVVVSAASALSPKLKASADLVLSLDDVKAEAFCLRRGQTPRLGLREFGLRAAAAEGPDAVPGGRPDWAAIQAPSSGRPPDGPPCSAGPSAAGPVRPAETEPTVRPEVFQTSPSALKLFEQCPFRYRRVYVEGRAEPPNRWTFVGNAVHQALKDFFASRPSERSWKLLEESLRRAWRRQPGREKAFTGPDDEAEAGRQTLADLKVFFEKCDRRAEPFALEVFLTTEVGEGVVVRGKVDRVDLLQPDDALVVIDYKTGRPPATPPSLIEEFQLPLYHAMVTEAYGRTVRRVVLHYLRGNVTFDFPLEEDDILRSKRRAFAIARAIQAEKEFRPRVSALCRLCPTLGECPSREEVERRYALSPEDARREEGDEGDLPF